MSQLNQNTNNLQTILETINNLPTAGSGSGYILTEADKQEIAEATKKLIEEASVGNMLWSETYDETVVGHHYPITLGFDLEAGTIYNVRFDDVMYAITCNNLISASMYTLGNLAVANSSFEDTGEPFVLYQSYGSKTEQALVIKDSGPHKIEIYRRSVKHYGNSYLAGKKILIIGDSINSGAGWEGGFANLMAEELPSAIVNNASVSGSCFAGAQIYYQLVSAYQAGFMPDYVIINGGGNDMLNGIDNGTLEPYTYSADGSGNEFNLNTLVGGFEYTITNLQTFLPHTKIIFFNLPKLRPDTTNLTYEKQKQTWQLLKEACEKYAICYIDLFNTSGINTSLLAHWNTFMYDWIHLNESGYRRCWPLIREALLKN